jgi:hypothetical protein
MRLVSGNLSNLQTRMLGLQFLFKRLQHESLSPAAKAGEIRTFFVKYEKILASEIAQLDNL